MSWRKTLAESLGYPQPETDRPKSWGQPPPDKLDNMDTIKAEGNSVHIVHSVHSPPGSTPCDGSSEKGILAPGPAECQAETVTAAKDVFGPGAQAEWVPAPASTTRCREEARDNIVCCCGCQHFQPGVGDSQHALGRCLGRPWDGHEGQWPRAPHHCANYTTSGGL